MAEPMAQEQARGVATVLYINWRGETETRHIVPASGLGALRFDRNEWHPEPGWLLEVFDVDRQAWRTFALSGIRGWREGWHEGMEEQSG